MPPCLYHVLIQIKYIKIKIDAYSLLKSVLRFKFTEIITNEVGYDVNLS